MRELCTATCDLAHGRRMAMRMICTRGTRTQRVTTRAKQHANDTRSSTPRCETERTTGEKNKIGDTFILNKY
jgi:hypothetical protein